MAPNTAKAVVKPESAELFDNELLAIGALNALMKFDLTPQLQILSKLEALQESVHLLFAEFLEGKILNAEQRGFLIMQYEALQGFGVLNDPEQAPVPLADDFSVDLPTAENLASSEKQDLTTGFIEARRLFERLGQVNCFNDVIEDLMDDLDQDSSDDFLPSELEDSEICDLEVGSWQSTGIWAWNDNGALSNYFDALEAGLSEEQFLLRLKESLEDQLEVIKGIYDSLVDLKTKKITFDQYIELSDEEEIDFEEDVALEFGHLAEGLREAIEIQDKQNQSNRKSRKQ